MAQDVETSSPDPGVNTRGYGRGSGETGLVWATWGFARHLPSVLCACIGQYYRYSSLILFQDECDEIPILIFFYFFIFFLSSSCFASKRDTCGTVRFDGCAADEALSRNGLETMMEWVQKRANTT